MRLRHTTLQWDVFGSLKFFRTVIGLWSVAQTLAAPKLKEGRLGGCRLRACVRRFRSGTPAVPGGRPDLSNSMLGVAPHDEEMRINHRKDDEVPNDAHNPDLLGALDDA